MIDPYDEGYDAALEYLPMQSNPHLAGTHEYFEWNRGYYDCVAEEWIDEDDEWN